MGWRRDNQERKIRHRGRGVTFAPADGQAWEGNDLDIAWGGFVFIPHFFDSYRARVADPYAERRTIEDMARIATHSIREVGIPKRMPLGENYNLLVLFHDHDDNGEETFFSTNYVPIRRDLRNLASGKIFVPTVMVAAEKMAKIEERMPGIYSETLTP